MTQRVRDLHQVVVGVIGVLGDTAGRVGGLDQARAILDAAPGEQVPLGREGALAYIDQKTISFRAGNGAGGGISALDKRTVIRQISEQLPEY